jgi:bacterioferritin
MESPGGEENHVSNNKEIVAQLNKLLASELEGANRYLHHSFMVFGFSRKPIVSYLREQSTESIAHATLLGEKIVALGGHPEVRIEAHWEPEKHSVREMLELNLEAEREALKGYVKLLSMVPKEDVALDEMTRDLIRQEQEHLEELEKYLRESPGSAKR